MARVTGVRRRGEGWEAYYRDPCGRERTKIFTLQKDAAVWRSERLRAMRDGTWLDPRLGHVRLRAYANDWLGERTDLRPTTFSKYRRLLDQHILPALGDAYIDRLDATTIKSWNIDLRGRRPATSADAYRLLSTIFNTAISDRLLLARRAE